MSGVEFHEVMSGRITIGATDPTAGFDDPGAIPASLRAVVRITDIDDFVAEPAHSGRLLGTIESPRLTSHFSAIATAEESTELVCSSGTFALFVPPPAPAPASERLMVYDAAISIDDDRYWMQGRKFVAPAPVWRGWRATTTLHVTLHHGLDGSAPVVAAGVLRLSAAGLLSLARSMHATGCTHWYQRVRTEMRFVRFFTSALVRTYLLRRPL